MKNLIVLFTFFYCSVGFTQDLALASETDINENFIYYRPHNVFENPNLLVSDFSSRDIPIEYYSEKEIELQKELNTKEEGIITFSKGDDKIFTRRIDQEAITPYSWKWVYLQVNEDDGSYTNIHLRRPNWWFVENNATDVGDNVHINIPQIGLNKTVSIVKIYPNQLDTRFWNLNKKEYLVTRPITGKVEHYVNNVVNLHFKENNKPLTVTTNHLLWSYDKDDWVKVENLKIGERLTTKDGLVTVKDRIKKEGWYTVYDIEVYRDHNFLVGSLNILAHNGCEWNPSGKINGRKIRNSDKAGQVVKTKGGDVKFDSSGFPDFSPYSKFVVKIEDMKGNLGSDVTKALNRLGLKRADMQDVMKKYVWHHHQDGKTMMLVRKDVHNTIDGGVGHTGGSAVTKHNNTSSNKKLSYPSPKEKLN